MRLFILLGIVVAAKAIATPDLSETGYSGQWYSTGRSGEGWVLEELDEGRAVVYWFTYDSTGSQRWFIAAGERSLGEGSVHFDFPDVYVTEGGKFGPEGSNADMVQENVGQLHFTFTSCNVGVVEYEIGQNSGERQVSRLGSLMNTPCAAPESELRTYASHTGSWYDADDSGEGLILQWLDRDEAVLLWFTYDDAGNQFWLIGTGQRSDEAVVFPDLLSTRGGVFGEAFDEDQVETSSWGSAVLELECSSGRVDFSSMRPNLGSGSIELDRLTSLEGFECPLFMPSKAEPETAEWDTRFTISGVSGRTISAPYVFDLYEASDGRLLAGGVFSWFGATRVFPLIETRGASSWVSALNELDEGFHSVTAISEVPGDGVVFADSGSIKINSEEGLREIGAYEGWIRRMVWHDGSLWVAGVFSMASEGPENLALWDGEVWQDVPGGGPDGPVFSLVSVSGTLYVGGEFSSVGGVNTPSVSAYDGSHWVPMGMQSDGSSISRVLALEVLSNGTILAGGDLLASFDDYGGAVAQWNGNEWNPLGEGFWSGDFPGVISDLEAFEGDIYAVGCFDSIGGPSKESGVPSHGVARWVGDEWQSLDGGALPIGTAWLGEPSCGWESHPFAVTDIEWARLKRYGGSLYIAGRFPGVAGIPSQSLIEFDGQAFVPQGDTDLGTHGVVDALALMPPDNMLYAYGPLRFGGELANSRLARLEEGNWVPVGPTVPDELNCRAGLVDNPLVITPEARIFLACNGNPTGRPEDSFGQILELREGEWLELFPHSDVGPIWDIQVGPTGDIWFSGGNDLPQPHGYIRRLIGSDAQLFEPDFDNVVSAIFISTHKDNEDVLQVLAAGSFDSVNGVPARSLSLWDGDSWSSLGGGSASVPSAIMLHEGVAFAANVTVSGEDEEFSVAAWESGSWENLATQARQFPSFDKKVVIKSIKAVGGRVYLSGQIIPDDDALEFGENVLLYDDGEFEGVAGGVSGLGVTISSMVFQDNAIVIGGHIVEANPYDEPNSSIGVARLIWK